MAGGLMRRLFINADDCGLTDGVTAGIAAAMRAGLVGGTTAMVCAAGAAERLRRMGAAFPGRIGLHLQLTAGRPCLPAEDVPSLVGPDGTFPRKKTAVGDVDPEEVRREWWAQLAALRALGIAPSHLDAHHHIHKRPELFPIFVELARELGVPARALTQDMRRQLDDAGVPHAAVCVTDWFAGDLSATRFCDLVEAAFAALPAGTTVEVMTHPGHCDAALAACSSYGDDRERELRTLTDPELFRMLTERGIDVVAPAAMTGRGRD